MNGLDWTGLDWTGLDLTRHVGCACRIVLCHAQQSNVSQIWKLALPMASHPLASVRQILFSTIERLMRAANATHAVEWLLSPSSRSLYRELLGRALVAAYPEDDAPSTVSADGNVDAHAGGPFAASDGAWRTALEALTEAHTPCAAWGADGEEEEGKKAAVVRSACRGWLAALEAFTTAPQDEISAPQYEISAPQDEISAPQDEIPAPRDVISQQRHDCPPVSTQAPASSRHIALAELVGAGMASASASPPSQLTARMPASSSVALLSSNHPPPPTNSPLPKRASTTQCRHRCGRRR